MALNLYNIKKWVKMFSGKSIHHVDQGPGKIYSKQTVRGYYNDLTLKVLKDPEVDKVKIPVYEIENNEEIYFPIMIFQYGLGAYDLFLLEKKDLYLQKFLLCAEWAMDNQQTDGSWDTFSFSNPEAPYSSMAQGEGASLLIRAFMHTQDKDYLKAAELALDFMLKDVEDGGTTDYSNGEYLLLEGTDMPVILNGWIFSLFGLYDHILIDNNSKYKDFFSMSVNSLENLLHKFDIDYWSLYDIEYNIASPFYHQLHIDLLNVLGDLTDKVLFFEYASKFDEYSKSKTNKLKAIVLKGQQKLKN